LRCLKEGYTLPKAKVNEFWEGEAELEIQNIAFMIPYDERTVGARKIRKFRPEFIKNGQVTFDAGKKFRGWIKEQARTIKPSAYEAIQYGFKSFSLPEAGEISIAKPEELIGTDDFPEKFKDEYEVPDGMPYPFLETIMVKEAKATRCTFAFYYLLPKAVRVKIKIFCFARNITPEVVQDMMEKLGPYTGLGDRHSQGQGTFKLINFKSNSGQLKL